MNVKPKDKRTEDENAIIDFALIYETILPKMYFYKIKNLILVQGFDLISQLVINFNHLGIEFIDLPITYQSIFGKIEIWILWYDDSLKRKILEFYNNHSTFIGLNSRSFRLHALPSSFIDNKKFERIFLNNDKFGIIINSDGSNKIQFDYNEFNSIFKDKIKSVINELWTYKLKWFDTKLEEELKNDIDDFNWELSNFAGFYLFKHSWDSIDYVLNLLNWSYQHSINKDIKIEKIKNISCFQIFRFWDEEQNQTLEKILNSESLRNNKKFNVETDEIPKSREEFVHYSNHFIFKYKVFSFCINL